MTAPELLAPAGNLNNLHYAIAYGADAVYAGMPRYSLRVRNNDFNRLENLAAGIEGCMPAARRFFWPAMCWRTTARSRPSWPTWSR
jgi:putative protease